MLHYVHYYGYCLPSCLLQPLLLRFQLITAADTAAAAAAAGYASVGLQ